MEQEPLRQPFKDLCAELKKRPEVTTLVMKESTRDAIFRSRGDAMALDMQILVGEEDVDWIPDDTVLLFRAAADPTKESIVPLLNGLDPVAKLTWQVVKG